MKKLLFSTLVLATAIQVSAQVRMPQASPTQTIKQDFGMGKIELTYSRPSIKGRKYFGTGTELAPLGAIWRTGANAPTKIMFTENVTIGDKLLDTGTYVIYTIPGKSEWEVILNKGLSNWGTSGYKESEDVVRTKVPANTMKGYVETFTMQFDNVKAESCDLTLSWGNTSVSVPVTTSVKEKLRAQVEEALKGDKKPYWQAANYYYDYEKDYAKALENVNKAVEANPKAFYMIFLKAKIQNDMGDKEGAKASANKTIEVATEEKDDAYVRMAKELLKKI